ncbi:MAG: right-handed parallel beta-helix repeat-containing protein [Chloroflexota bacterium]|nr:right-handed parallel beta-helix repeat-containing protein [Chloroflexota bacterium]
MTGILIGPITLNMFIGSTPAAAASVPAQSYKRTVLNDQPVAYWRLDEASGTTASDASGHGHNGTIGSGVDLGETGALSGDPDKAVGFDGQTGSIRTQTSISVGTDFTIEAWVKVASATQNAPVVSLYDGQSTRTLYVQGQQFRGMADVSANWPSYAVLSSSVDTTTWHHVVFSVQGGTKLAMYVDGALSASATVPATSAFSASAVLGWSDATWLNKFGGTVDEVALYSKTLSAYRIQAHYVAGAQTAGTNGATPTAVPPTSVPPTATAVPPTATAVPPTATAVPPTATSVPPTATAVPPTATAVPPTATAVPPTATPVPGCTATLQSLIDAAAGGSTIVVPGCVYRETIAINKPLTLDGQGKAELRGSDSWTDWSQSGSTWISANSVPNLGSDTTGVFTDAFRASHLEQVFVDAAGLAQVPSNPNASQFALDGSRHVILGTSPNGHLVEVTTRKSWALNQANNVTITNFTFRHAATAGQQHAIGNDDHANWVLSNSTLTDAHGSAIGLGGGDVYSSVLNNTVTGSGDQAITGYLDGHTLIRGNTMTQNGLGGWDPNWGAGGLKTASSTNQTVDSNTVYSNGGPGIWCDLGCVGVTYTNNTVHDNVGAGIMFEISNTAKIFGNQLWRNTGFGQIYVSSSANAEVSNNVVAWGYGPVAGVTAGGVTVSSNNRSDQSFNQVGTINNNVHDNTMMGPVTNSGQMVWYQDSCSTESWCLLYKASSNNRGSNNNFWYPGPEDGSQRFYWNFTSYASLSMFNATVASTPGGMYLTDSQKTQMLASRNMPAAP